MYESEVNKPRSYEDLESVIHPRPNIQLNFALLVQTNFQAEYKAQFCRSSDTFSHWWIVEKPDA